MKRNVPFIHLFLTTTAMLTIAGCGANKNPGGASGSFSTNTAISATRDLTTTERAVATRICYAYQSKNTSFKTQTYYGGTFVFDMKNKSCSATSAENYSVTGVLQTKAADGTLYYNSTTQKTFEPKVQTSTSGFLATLCSKIQNNQAISNTAVVSNVTVQVAFTTTNDLDSYTLNYFSSVNNVMKIQSAETFRVRTQFNQTATQILGMDEVYQKQAVCTSDTSKFSDLTQTYRSFTAP